MDLKKQTYSVPMCVVHTMAEEMAVICASMTTQIQQGVQGNGPVFSANAPKQTFLRAGNTKKSAVDDSTYDEFEEDEE